MSSPEAVFAAIAHRPGAVWLDSGRHGEQSILAFDPIEVIQAGDRWPEVGRRLSDRHWVLGYIGYGAGHRVEDVPAQAPTAEPELWLGKYAGVLLFDHQTDQWTVDGDDAFARKAHALLASAAPLPPPPAAVTPSSVDTTRRERHEDGVRTILEHIRAGDCYQVNLTRPVFVRGAGDPFDGYRRLRHASAPAFGAFLRLSDDTAIVSNSPELFLEVRGSSVVSEPIKGTRPRCAAPAENKALIDELLHSPKEKAELTMIVDLVRNDLGRIAVPGTVVAEERRIHTHANVHHAHQAVRAQLEGEHDCWSALAATFPPGSVTGAPKVRATQRINEIEDGPRGVYCGAIGYVAPNGDAAFSVAIRTAVWSGTTARYHVGGGIVADSDPAAEYDETLHKGSAFRQALGIGTDVTETAMSRNAREPGTLRAK